MTGYVYFLRSESGDVKIGFATDVARRVRQLQRASPMYLSLLGCRPGTRALEAEFHQHFAGQRLHGEWFASSAQLLANAWGVGPDGQPQSFTQNQVAELLGLDPRTVTHEVNLGSLLCGLNADGSRFFTPDHIEDWTENGYIVREHASLGRS